MDAPSLRSIQTGKVQTHGMPDVSSREPEAWITGFWKGAVTGPVMLSTLGLEGDEHHYYKHGGPDKARLVQKARRTGWYLRVLTEGYVESGLPVRLLDRPYPQWTVSRAIEVMSKRGHDRETALQLGACPVLATAWREVLLSISPA